MNNRESAPSNDADHDTTMQSATICKLTPLFVLFLASCTIRIGKPDYENSESHDPITVSFSDGSTGEVELVGKTGSWIGRVPSTIYVPKGSERLTYIAKVDDNRRSASGYVHSSIAAEIAGSKGFSGFEKKHAIADRYWSYPNTLVIEVPRAMSETDR